MADWEYDACRYSITCLTDDLAIVHCLRSLCEFSEERVHKNIAWGGTGAGEWKKANNQITLRFSDPAFRDRFVREATRLLPSGSWREVGRSDQDPAKRQRPKADA